MTVTIRLEFKAMPDPSTIASVIGIAKIDPEFRDSDLIEEKD